MLDNIFRTIEKKKSPRLRSWCWGDELNAHGYCLRMLTDYYIVGLNECHQMKSEKIKGYLYAALAAAAYGTNPAFALPLYADGMNPNSVLLFRYILGIPIIALIMKTRGVNFRIDSKVLLQTMILGVLMALSSLTLFESYQYMNSGIASTLLFMYPIMVAMIMIFFFHEKLHASVFVCLAVMTAGLAMLIHDDDTQSSFSYLGCLLVFISALTYALYIVIVNVSKTLNKIPTTKLLFYVLSWGSLVYLVKIPFGSTLTFPAIPHNWLNLIALAAIPTILSLALTTRAIHLVGSTPTAILGALEPVTAVVLSIFFLNQKVTVNEIVGGFLIVVATIIVICGKQVDTLLLHVRKMFPRRPS